MRQFAKVAYFKANRIDDSKRTLAERNLILWQPLSAKRQSFNVFDHIISFEDAIPYRSRIFCFFFSDESMLNAYIIFFLTTSSLY
jgi:hypothetical protein